MCGMQLFYEWKKVFHTSDGRLGGCEYGRCSDYEYDGDGRLCCLILEMVQ